MSTIDTKTTMHDVQTGVLRDNDDRNFTIKQTQHIPQSFLDTLKRQKESSLDFKEKDYMTVASVPVAVHESDDENKRFEFVDSSHIDGGKNRRLLVAWTNTCPIYFCARSLNPGRFHHRAHSSSRACSSSQRRYEGTCPSNHRHLPFSASMSSSSVSVPSIWANFGFRANCAHQCWSLEPRNTRRPLLVKSQPLPPTPRQMPRPVWLSLPLVM